MAKVEFEEFKAQITNIYEVASMGSETSYVKLSFWEDKIEMETENNVGSGSNVCRAVMIEGNGCSFYYHANMLKDLFRTVEGTLILQVDKRGYLIVFDKYNKYMLTAVREGAVEKQAKKFAEKKKELQKKSKRKTEATAA